MKCGNLPQNFVQFCKTHSYLFNFYDKYPFTNLENSLGVIYIVRDPRNVVSSYANFLSCSEEKSANIMIEELSKGGNLGQTIRRKRCPLPNK